MLEFVRILSFLLNFDPELFVVLIYISELVLILFWFTKLTLLRFFIILDPHLWSTLQKLLDYYTGAISYLGSLYRIYCFSCLNRSCDKLSCKIRFSSSSLIFRYLGTFYSSFATTFSSLGLDFILLYDFMMFYG